MPNLRVDSVTKSLLGQSHFGVAYVRRRDGKIIEANQRFADLLGCEHPDDLESLSNLTDLIRDPELRERLSRERLDQVDSAGLEVEFYRDDGSETWCLLNHLPHPSDNAGLLVLIDITALKHGEMAARQHADLLQSIVDSAPLDINVKDLDGKYLEVNKNFLASIGLPKSEVIGKSFTETFGEEIGEAIQKIDEEVINSDSTIRREVTYPTIHGDRPYYTIKFPIHGDKGDVEAVGTISSNISDLKVAEGALRESEERFRDFAESTSDWVWETDADLRFTLMSENHSRVTGLKPEIFIGKTLREVGNPEFPTTEWNSVVSDMEAHVPMRDREIARRHPDGHVVYFSVSGKPLFDEAGRFKGYRGTGTDHSEEKEAIRRLRLQALINKQMSDGVIVTDMDGTIMDCNPAAEKMFGYGPGEMTGLPTSEVHHDAVPGTTMQMITESMNMDGSFAGEIEILRKDGEVRFFEVSVMPLRDESGDVIARVGVNRDITERRRSEEEDKKKSDLALLLRKTAIDANKAIEFEEAIRTCVETVIDYTGWPVGHVYLVSEYDPGLLVPSGIWHLEDPDAFASFVRATEATNFGLGEGLPGRVFASGEPSWIVDVTVDPNFPRAKLADDIGVRGAFAFPVIATGEIVAVLEFFDRDPAKPDELLMATVGHIGGQLGRVAERTTAQNELAKYRDHLEELVDERTLALEQTEDALRQSQKMEAIGQLTGGISHDFNNLLSVIMGNAELLEEYSDGRSDEERELLAAVIRSANRGAELTHRLLAFSRNQTLNPESIHLGDQVRGMTGILKRSLGETIEVTTSEGLDLWPAYADPGQVENALLNLAINARDAMPEGGKLAIETFNVTLDEAYVQTQTDLEAGEYVVLSVSDTGTGMSKEVASRVIEPFYTTKEGTGLGLSMVFGFAKQSGGHLAISSEEGVGTSVKLHLPRSRAEVEATVIQEDIRGATSPDEVVMVVEDDVEVRKLVVSLLSSLGYQTLEASDGPASLDLFRSDARIDLLLTDIVLPGGFLGAEVARQARRLRPAIKVMYMSGYTDNAAFDRSEWVGGGILIQKPFRKFDLAKKVRDVLDRPAGKKADRRPG